MKFLTVVALFACAVSVYSQIPTVPGVAGPPPVALPPVIPPFGPFGIGGLPFIPPIFPPIFSPFFFRPFFGLRRFGLLGLGLPFLGKRDVDDSKVDMDKVVDKVARDLVEIADKVQARGVDGKIDMDKLAKVVEKINERGVETVVDTVEEKKKLEAQREAEKVIEKLSLKKVVGERGSNAEQIQLRIENGFIRVPEQKIECAVRERLGDFASLRLQLTDLVLIKREGQTTLLDIVSRGKQITAVSPSGRDILLSLFSGEQTGVVGYQVVEPACWRQISDLVGTLRPEEYRVTLNL